MDLQKRRAFELPTERRDGPLAGNHLNQRRAEGRVQLGHREEGELRVIVGQVGRIESQVETAAIKGRGLIEEATNFPEDLQQVLILPSDSVPRQQGLKSLNDHQRECRGSGVQDVRRAVQKRPAEGQVTLRR